MRGKNIMPSSLINWYDTRLHKSQVDSFFSELIDLINSLKDLHLPIIDETIKKYGVEIYCTEYENNQARIKFIEKEEDND